MDTLSTRQQNSFDIKKLHEFKSGYNLKKLAYATCSSSSSVCYSNIYQYNLQLLKTIDQSKNRIKVKKSHKLTWRFSLWKIQQKMPRKNYTMISSKLSDLTITAK